ncbi:MAG: hypothetical protein R2713_14590 [Ilumatobacteraceae bacterium]
MRPQEGQVLDVDPASRPTLPAADPSVEFGVVYADDQVVVVDSRWPDSSSTRRRSPDGTLVNGLLARFPDIAEVGQAGRPGTCIASTSAPPDCWSWPARRSPTTNSSPLSLVATSGVGTARRGWGRPGQPDRRDRRSSVAIIATR